MKRARWDPRRKNATHPPTWMPIYQHVLTLFDSDQEKLRAFAVHFFGATEPVDEARAHLLKAFSDPSAIVRAAAICTPWRISMTNNLRDRDSDQRRPGPRCRHPDAGRPGPGSDHRRSGNLDLSGEERILPFNVVQPFLTSDHKGIRLRRDRALLFDTSDEAQQVLLDTHPRSGPRRSGQPRASASTTPSRMLVRERMIQLLGDNDRLVRIRALQSLDANPHPAALPAIKALLTHEADPDVIRVANDSLGSP